MKVGTDGTLLGAWARGGARILDVGTGTGLIALMMAQRYPGASVVGIDVDADAVAQAAANAAASPFARQVSIRQVAVQDFVGEAPFDALVCNPPYFIDALRNPDGQRSTARHCDTLSYADLMTASWRLLDDGGRLSVVIPFDYRSCMESAAALAGFSPSRVCAVQTSARKPARRFLLEFAKHPQPATEQTQLVIGDAAYTSLTAAFYL